MKRMNKKGSVVGIFLYLMLLTGWFMAWVFIIDPIDFALDQGLNQTWEAFDHNATYYDMYATFKNARSNFKPIAFWGGVIGITAMFIASSYMSRGEQIIGRY